MDESGVMGWIKSHLIIVVGGLIVAVLFLKKVAPGGSSTATTMPIDTSGLAKDANGNPIVYRDVQDSFVNIYHNIDSNNVDNSVTATSTSTINPNPIQPVASSPPPPPSTPAAPVEHPIEQTHSYTIVGGDTLSAIAARNGETWQQLYQKNQSVIDSTSAAHGNPIPGGAFNNIFPGEIINL